MKGNLIAIKLVIMV